MGRGEIGKGAMGRGEMGLKWGQNGNGRNGNKPLKSCLFRNYFAKNIVFPF
jgi:hypothetical protein